jgi:hypothetical protein
MNAGIKKLEYKLIVTHAGTASVFTDSEIKAGKLSATFPNHFLIRTANR